MAEFMEFPGGIEYAREAHDAARLSEPEEEPDNDVQRPIFRFNCSACISICSYEDAYAGFCPRCCRTMEPEIDCDDL